MGDPVAVLEQLARDAVAPKDVKQLRACIKCHLVKTVKQFEKDGCENCEQSYGDDYEDKMSVNFTGVAAIMQPEQSWVARWLRKQKLVPGCYAMEVAGESFED